MQTVIKNSESTSATPAQAGSSSLHVKMIMSTRHVTIVDTKYKPLTRAKMLNVDETVSEESFSQIFAEVVAALSQSGNMVSDGSAACITFPEGTIQVDVPLPGGVN